MSEPIKASDTPGSASTPKDTDAKSRRKRIILFSLLGSDGRSRRRRLLQLLEARRFTLCVDR